MLAMCLREELPFPKLHKHQSLSMSAPPPDGVGDPFLKPLLIHTSGMFQTSQRLPQRPIPFEINL